MRKMIRVDLENGILAVQFPYDAVMVNAIKSLPSPDRRWEASRKLWLVDPKHGQELVAMARDYLGEKVILPASNQRQSAAETLILEIKYLGVCRDRGDGTRTAFGWYQNSWNVIFPENVLRAWFNADARPGEESTLYAVLGLPQSAAGADVKAAYRRLSLQWHPDVSKEPDAAEEFLKIKHAYDVLRDPAVRAKYDAGLRLAATLPQRAQGPRSDGYRSPLRCGYILCEGTRRLGRFVVTKILSWQDVTDHAGRVLIVSWPKGAEAPLEVWQ